MTKQEAVKLAVDRIDAGYGMQCVIRRGNEYKHNGASYADIPRGWVCADMIGPDNVQHFRVVPSFADETLRIAREFDINVRFVEEVQRLLRSGAVDREDHHRGMLFGVAVENVADNWLRGERTKADYKNLKKF